MNVQELTFLRDHISIEILFWRDIYFTFNNILNEEQDRQIRLHIQAFLRTVDRLIQQLRFEHQVLERDIQGILRMRR